MATCFKTLVHFSSLLLLLLITIINPCISQISPNPKSLFLQTTKDKTSSLHYTKITQKDHTHHHHQINLLIDLGSQTLWVDCESEGGYNATNKNLLVCYDIFCPWYLTNITKCYIPTCSEYLKAPSCGLGCAGGMCCVHGCEMLIVNPMTQEGYEGVVVEDDLLIQSIYDGLKPGNIVTLPKFYYTCTSSGSLKGLNHLNEGGVKGVAALGRHPAALPSQLAHINGLPRKFSVCLSSSPESNGLVVFSHGPIFSSDDFMKNLVYTPLIWNEYGVGAKFKTTNSSEYYIGVRAIKVNGKEVKKLNTTLLAIDAQGNGGTKISTTTPYTVLESSIFLAVTEAFIKEMSSNNFLRASPMEPLKVCFQSTGVSNSAIGGGLEIPTIDLVLEGEEEEISWRIYGSNSMVRVKEDVMCLGFVDRARVASFGGGFRLKTSVVIGAHQLEDNFLQFDLEKSRVGFTSLVPFHKSCASINFRV